MAVPGWPAFACWTASIASVRMVSIERCSMSVFLVTKLLVETLLPFSGRTICLCPRLPRMEHVSEGGRDGLVTQPFPDRNRRSTQRCLVDRRRRHRPGERVGHQLDPLGIGEERAAGGDDLLE